MQRTLLGATLALAIVFSISPKAQAQELHTLGDPDVFAGLFVTTAVLGSVWAGFLVADTVSFARGTPFDVELAVTDLVLGTLAVGGGVVALVYASIAGEVVPPLIALGGGALALGAYEISHGFWSLGAPHHGQAVQPSLSVAPMANGAFVSLSGTF